LRKPDFARFTQGLRTGQLADVGVKFSEEAVEEVTGYRVDMLLHGGDGLAAGRCTVEVGVDAIIAFPTPPSRSPFHYLHRHFVAFGISIRSSCRCRLFSIWPFLFAVCLLLI
jgi:hypothetical protein